MRPNELDKLITQSLDVEDHGFTEKVLSSLPSEKKSIFQKTQLYVWGVAFVLVFVIMIVASQYSAIALGNSSGSIAITLVAFAVFIAHFDDLKV